jgi:hypothetical protein
VEELLYNLDKALGMHTKSFINIYPFIFFFNFLALYHCFGFNKYTGISKLPFRVLVSLYMVAPVVMERLDQEVDSGWDTYYAWKGLTDAYTFCQKILQLGPPERSCCVWDDDVKLIAET